MLICSKRQVFWNKTLSKKNYVKIDKKEFEEFLVLFETMKSDLEVLKKENNLRFDIGQFLEKLNKDFCEAENFITKLAEKF